MRIVIWTLMVVAAACSTTGGGQDVVPPLDAAGDPGVVDRAADPGEDPGFPDPGLPGDPVPDPGRPDPGVTDPGSPDPGEGDPWTLDDDTADPGLPDPGGDPGADSVGEPGVDSGPDPRPDVVCAYQCDLPCPCAKDEAGCDLPECDEAACEAALAAVDQFVAAHGACADAQQCVAFEYPICDTFGCFQVAVNAQADLVLLTDLAVQAQAAGCEDFSCGCEDPPAVPACIEGLCRLCPPDCGTTCEGIGAAILAEADTLNHCEWSDECWTEDTGVCNLPDLPCGYVPVQAGSDTGLIYELSQASVALGCQAGCSCGPPPETLYCIGGRCLAEPSCEQLIAHAQAVLADPASTTCGSNTDCQLVNGDVPPLCAPDDACWCAVAVNSAALMEFEYLTDAILARGCGTGGLCACDAVECSEPKAACAAGSCVPLQPVE